MIEPLRYPIFQVRPQGLLIYEKVEWPYSRRREKSEVTTTDNKTEENQKVRNSEFYTGQLTPYAKKKLRRAINLMIASALPKEATHFKSGKKFKFKINFITLTLPAAQKEVTDRELKKYCLDNWIKRMKRKHGLKSYVWRAERQKNGNLHFHIMSDCYIRYDYIRNDWNALLQRFHFIDEFQKANGHRNPNSTDVHSVQKIHNLAAYMVKYMSKKTPPEERVEGKIWDCSKNLKTKSKCEMFVNEEQEEIWCAALEIPKTFKVHEERFSMIILSENQLNQVLKGKTKQEWEKYLNEIRDG